MKSVAVNRNSGYGHSMWAQRPWQEILYTTESDMTASLPRSLGICFHATNGDPVHTWGHLLPGRKAVTYLQEPPSSAI